MNPLTPLSLLSLLLLIGIIVAGVAYRFKLPDILLLLLAGLVFGHFSAFEFDTGFLFAFSVFALIMILFDSTSNFKINEIRKISPSAMRLALVFFVFCVVLLSIATYLLFTTKITDLSFLVLATLFGALMSGTSPDVLLSIMRDKKQKIAELLEFESIINTPLAVLIPFLIVDFYSGSLVTKTIPIIFLQQVMTGVGTGLILGFVFFKIMRYWSQKILSPLAVIAAALISYTLAEFLNGNGVLSVTTLGFMFGFMILKEKESIREFSSIFTAFLKIVVFILLGLMIELNFNLVFLIKSLVLFGIYLGIRYLSVKFTFRKQDITFKEKLFMTLSAAKGVAVATVIFLLLSYDLPGLKGIVDLSLLFVLYSIIVSSISTKIMTRIIPERRNVLKNRGIIRKKKI